MSYVNAASIWWITMNLNIVSTYCYLSVTLSHGFLPVDEKGSTFVQSVSLHERFPSFEWKPRKSKLLLKDTVGVLHGSGLSRWNLFHPLNYSVATYNLVKCQYFFSGPSHSTMRLFWNESLGATSFRCFPMKNVFRLFSHPISLQWGHCSGLEYSGWSIPVSFMLILVILSLHRNLSFFIKLFQHIVYGWIVMLLYAQRYFLHITFASLQSHKTS